MTYDIKNRTRKPSDFLYHMKLLKIDLAAFYPLIGEF